MIFLIICVVLITQKSNEKSTDYPKEMVEESAGSKELKPDTSKPTKKKNASNTAKQSDDSTSTSGSSTTSSAKSSNNSEVDNDSDEEVTPESTTESRAGLALEDFPFPIMTDPPHSVHDPVTDFASTTVNPNKSYDFVLPEITNDIGLYGRFWLSPTPPTVGAKLVGVRIVDAVSSGTMDNSIAVFSLLDRNTENNALGSVTGAFQGLSGELVAVIFDDTPADIELRLTAPVANSGERFVFVVDSENLPSGNPTTYPTSISVGKIKWLWSAP